MKKFKIIILILLLISTGIFSGFYIMNTLLPGSKKENEVQLSNNIISEEELENIISVDTQFLQDIEPINFTSGRIYSKSRFKMGPFTDYRSKPLPVSVSEEIKDKSEQIKAGPLANQVLQPPFKLTGIVGNSTRRLAVIQTPSETIIGRILDQIGNFTIIQIQADRILLSFENNTHELVIGSDSFENKNI